MSNKTCKSCKHWVKCLSEDIPWPAINRGPFTGQCVNPKLNYDKTGYDKVSIDSLLYVDCDNYEGYSVGFFTGENFGCIHWSPVNEQ